ncbi:hypothetical protein [Bradyrhizobium sp.]|uniref:hypothetical protein n=1 Tax=Bradyrhizobium sp. TaxID=376 RepID=UPI002D1FB113|nr:hypothetical protein [Bradyrhizobium sp.]
MTCWALAGPVIADARIAARPREVLIVSWDESWDELHCQGQVRRHAKSPWLPIVPPRLRGLASSRRDADDEGEAPGDFGCAISRQM